MKRHLTLWLFGAFVCVPVSAAEKVAIEVGQGMRWMKGVKAGFVRYSNDLEIPNLSQPGFYEVYVGSWNHKDPNSAAGVAVGAQGRWSEFHLDASVGVAWLENKTHLSGTHQQFALHVGIGYTAGKFDFSIARTHFSNAKWTFDWDGPNMGYDFLTFQVGYVLK